MGPGREVMGGACSCCTREEEREGALDMLGAEVVPRPPSRSRTVFRDFLLTVWMPEGLAEFWLGLEGVGGLGPGGLASTLGEGLAGRACWAMMCGGRPGAWVCSSLCMLDRGLTVVEDGVLVVARLRFKMDRPPPLGDGEVAMAEGLLGPISSFELLLLYKLRRWGD